MLYIFSFLSRIDNILTEQRNGDILKLLQIYHNDQKSKLMLTYMCDPSGEKGPSGGQLSKSIFSHKLVNKLLNDTFINFISSQYMYFVKKR